MRKLRNPDLSLLWPSMAMLGNDLSCNRTAEAAQQMRIPVLYRETPLGRIDTRKLAGTGVFAALSIVMSPIAFMLPRVGWGQAIIDPVSLPWMFCFFLFGLNSGLSCAAIGALALFFFDPTAIPFLGPLWKLIATTTLMIVPYVLRRSFRGGQQVFATFRAYAFASIPAIMVRAVIMPPLVLLYFSFLFGSWWEFQGGLVIVAATIAALNTLQSIVDVGVPWATLYATKRFLYSSAPTHLDSGSNRYTDNRTQS